MTSLYHLLQHPPALQLEPLSLLLLLLLLLLLHVDIHVNPKGHRREYGSRRSPVESSPLIHRYHGEVFFSAVKVGKFDDP
jgi:hypothetical protein